MRTRTHRFPRALLRCGEILLMSAVFGGGFNAGAQLSGGIEGREFRVDLDEEGEVAAARGEMHFRWVYDAASSPASSRTLHPKPAACSAQLIRTEGGFIWWTTRTRDHSKNYWSAVGPGAAVMTSDDCGLYHLLVARGGEGISLTARGFRLARKPRRLIDRPERDQLLFHFESSNPIADDAGRIDGYLLIDGEMADEPLRIHWYLDAGTVARSGNAALRDWLSNLSLWGCIDLTRIEEANAFRLVPTDRGD